MAARGLAVLAGAVLASCSAPDLHAPIEGAVAFPPGGDALRALTRAGLFAASPFVEGEPIRLVVSRGPSQREGEVLGPLRWEIDASANGEVNVVWAVSSGQGGDGSGDTAGQPGSSEASSGEPDEDGDASVAVWADAEVAPLAEAAGELDALTFPFPEEAGAPPVRRLVPLAWYDIDDDGRIDVHQSGTTEEVRAFGRFENGAWHWLYEMVWSPELDYVEGRAESANGSVVFLDEDHRRDWRAVIEEGDVQAR